MSDVDRILDSGNPEAIDAYLSALEQGVSEEAALAQAVESSDTSVAPPAAEPPIQNAPVAEPPAADTPEPVVLTKDGRHEIPYSVLESERQKAAAASAQLQELARRNALLEQQLTDANIKPKELPENVRFTAEQLAELESYGEIGAAVATLAQQNAVLMEQLHGRQVVPASAEPRNPFAENPDTNRWAQDDTQWAVVETVAAAVGRDPNWINKPLEQRVPEIARRTKLALGEATTPSIDQAADAALQRAVRVAPNSLTDVGGEVPGASKTTAEQLADGDMADFESYLLKQQAKGMSMADAIASAL